VTNWRELRDEAAGCTRCDLYERATQTIFGEGPTSAAIALWTERGKRRIHQRPAGPEIRACGYWLTAELEVVRPRLVVLLGAVAGQAMFGSKYRVGEHQGKAQEGSLGSWHGVVVGTIHPSAVLRGPDSDSRDRAYAGLVADLVTAREAVELIA
jgi:uracil-DNA glycosylase